MPATLAPPLLLGHRGARPVRRFRAGREPEPVPPENSLAAFRFALHHGCDGVEFDVRQSQDGRSVLWHDETLCGKVIATTEYAELCRARGEPVDCLEDALSEFGSHAYLDIELKAEGHEESVLAALRSHPPKAGYLLSSFLPAVLLRLHELDSSLPLGLLCDRVKEMEPWRSLPVTTFLPRCDLVEGALVQQVHAHGVKLLTWTVNHSKDMLRLAARGVDGLISDDPAMLVQTLRPRRDSGD